MKLIIASMLGAVLISMITVFTPVLARHERVNNPDCTLDCGFSPGDYFDTQLRGIPFSSVELSIGPIPTGTGLITGDDLKEKRTINYGALIANFIISGAVIYLVGWLIQRNAHNRN